MTKKEKVQDFLELLLNYCDLSIFKNQSFISGIKVNWNSQIIIDGKSPEENLRLGNFGTIPGGFKQEVKHPPYIIPLSLSQVEIKEREQAKVIIRRIFLKSESTNIWKILNIIFYFDIEYGGIQEMILNTLKFSPISFGESFNELENDYCLKLKIGNYSKDITKNSLDTIPLLYIDIFILYLHGNYIHADKDKKILYDLVEKYYSKEIVDSIIDAYLIQIFRISQLLLIPASEGFLVKNIENH